MLVLLQARISSKRLPGKVLRLINKKPMILRIVEQLKKSKKIKKICVLTSFESEDKKLVSFCKKNNLDFFIGELNDVSQRYKKFLESTLLKHKNFIRITADSPLIDYKLVEKLINIFKNKKVDIVTNVFPRSFPKGQTVEIIDSNVFLKNQKYFLKNSQKEHITSYFYENNKKFKIINFKNKVNYSNFNMSVDLKHDLKKVRYIFRELIDNNKNQYYSWKDLISYFQ